MTSTPDNNNTDITRTALIAISVLVVIGVIFLFLDRTKLANQIEDLKLQLGYAQNTTYEQQVIELNRLDNALINGQTETALNGYRSILSDPNSVLDHELLANRISFAERLLTQGGASSPPSSGTTTPVDSLSTTDTSLRTVAERVAPIDSAAVNRTPEQGQEQHDNTPEEEEDRLLY